MYYDAITHFAQTLGNIERWLDKAVAHAAARSFDPSTLLTARLAPDQYPLVRQIQSACDAAKAPAARLAGREPPKHPDTETTLAEIRTRLQTVLAFLGTFSAADFEGADNRLIGLPFIPGKALTGRDYLYQLAIPNFNFHTAMTYAILRHNGVDLGKIDYIGHLSLKDL